MRNTVTQVAGTIKLGCTKHNVINHKNYNFLTCDWFKQLLFPTNSLAKLLSDSLYRIACYRTVQQTNQIQSCSLNQPITFKVVV